MPKPFSKIFDADVTFNNTVSSHVAGNGTPFKKSQGASVVMPDGETVTRTVMGFGDQIDGITLRKGRKIRLSIQRDGGSMKIIGLPRAA
jgi:hypothetical protein